MKLRHLISPFTLELLSFGTMDHKPNHIAVKHLTIFKNAIKSYVLAEFFTMRHINSHTCRMIISYFLS